MSVGTPRPRTPARPSIVRISGMTPSWTPRTNEQRWPTSASSGTDSRSTRTSDEHENEHVAQRIDFLNTDKPPRKSNSSYGTPEDLIDLETPTDVPKKTQPQIFSMTARPLHPAMVNDDWEMTTKRLTEKDVNLRCPKLLDRNLARQRHGPEPRRHSKKDDDNYDEMNERGINLCLPKALEKNNKIAKNGPPCSSPPSSTSSSSSDADNSLTA